MEISANVKSIEKLKDYFFVVPDYQREYVWKVDDEVEQFLADIDNEFDAEAQSQNSYFIGSIIIVENAGRYDVIDGQQRLTTIVLSICALRDLLKDESLSATQDRYFDLIKNWLADFDLKSEQIRVRLELQYDDSKGYLQRLIEGKDYSEEKTASIKRMQQAYDRIRTHFEECLLDGIEGLMAYARYFLTGIELVVIESEDLSSALKIFETINQRGAGLNAMDLVKNLLFSEAKESEFALIKETWKRLNQNLESCGEEQSPLRFLRYFMVARYHNGLLRDDKIYKWIISPEGKQALSYQDRPLELAKELEKASLRYANLVNATGLMKDGGRFPSVTNIGFINKYKSRQHLFLLLAPSLHCPDSVIEYLAGQIESFLFFTNTIGIQSKYKERLFSQWAIELRNASIKEDIDRVVKAKIMPYLGGKIDDFKRSFATLRHSAYNPQYRQRFVLGKIENTLRERCGLQRQSLAFIQGFQIEHVLPQSPKDGLLPDEFEDMSSYREMVYRLGNVTLLESQINQAVNNYNDMNSDWFERKQGEYRRSDVLAANLLDADYAIGKNTALNRYRESSGYSFLRWGSRSIEARQKMLMDLAFDAWLIGGERLDQFQYAAEEEDDVAADNIVEN